MWTVISVCLHSRLRLFMSPLIHSSPLIPLSFLTVFISSILRRNFVLWLILLAISGCAWYILFFLRTMSFFLDIFFILGLEIKEIKIFDHWKSDFLIKLYSFFYYYYSFLPISFLYSSYNTIKFESFFLINNP